MLRISLKITQHAKNFNSHEESQSMNVNTKVTQILKLPAKDFTVATIALLQQVIIHIIEVNRKIKVMANEG